jgi:hypothetical protein
MPIHLGIICEEFKYKKTSLPQLVSKMFLRCLLKRVKTQLRVPKMQRATFLNNIVTANTDFSRIFIKKRYGSSLKASIYQENSAERKV